MAERCGINIEGPKQAGTRSAVRWRKNCKAYRMRTPSPPIDGFDPNRCREHQPHEVRMELYRRKNAERQREAVEYRSIHGHYPGEVGRG